MARRRERREHGAAVTDTHPLIYYAGGSSRLGAEASAFFARCERREAILYVPAAVIWECSLLARVGRIHLRRSVRQFFDDLFSNSSYQPLDLESEHVFLADEQKRFNNDPFDGLIVAAARATGLPLITRDREISASDIETIW